MSSDVSDPRVEAVAEIIEYYQSVPDMSDEWHRLSGRTH